MKKGLLLFWLSFVFIGNIFAQQDVFKTQGLPRPDVVMKQSLNVRNVQEDTSFTFEDIEFWVGSGSNKTAITIKWNDGKPDDALVWGYQWDGDMTVMEALKAIAWEDERLFLLLDENDAIAGIAFDSNGENIQSVIYNGNAVYPGYPVDGLLVISSTTDFDKYANSDPEDHWNAGKTVNGIWNYLIKEGEDFIVSERNAHEQTLENGSWNAFNFNLNFENPFIGEDFIAVSEYVREEVDYTKGIFFVNEDWFGWRNGSLNFLTESGEWVYRAYSRENRGQAFGCTTTYGTIYGDNFYFVSKQPADGGDKQYVPGGRLVVADAKTLKKKANFEEIGGGDGRAFLGVDENTGYISTSSGIVLFDISTLTLGNKVSGTEGGSEYAGQMGTMLRIGDYVFACKQSTGILVIDANRHEVITSIECKNIGTIVQSKDGYLWATAYTDGLWKIDPYTFEVLEKREIPTEAVIPGSWGAWSSSLICASDKTNTLYWAKMNGASMTFFGTKVFKYDIDNPDLSKPFYELTRANEAFYGSGMNIDPVTENLVITTTQTGYGSNYQYNWVHFVNSETGELIEVKNLDLYYWFPTMSTFPDNYEPVISSDLAHLAIDGRVEVSLLGKVTDPDNRNGAIIKQLETIEGAENVRASIERGNLVLQPLSKNPATLKLTANSNGKIVSQQIEVDVTGFTSVQAVELDKSQIEISPRETYQLTATVYPENASNKTVLWSSSNELAATVDKNGVVQPLQSGKTVTITAGTEDGKKVAVCTVLISPVAVAGMTLNAEAATLDARVKETLQLTPTFTPEDATNQSVNWSSSNPEIASVDENGKVTALQEGKATITAVSAEGGFEATCEITTYVSIQIARMNFGTTMNLQVGTTHQAAVVITPENATYQTVKEWRSGNPEVVSVDENGLITALQSGSSVTISAILEDKEGERTVTGRINPVYVVEEVLLTPEKSYLPIGEELRLDATILPENAYTKVVSWESSNEEIATVDNMWGMVYTYTTVKALAEGEVTITVTTYSESKTARATVICVIPVEDVSIETETTELFIGETLQLSTVVLPENATIKNVTWSSSDPQIATIDENGVVTALTEGEVTITVMTEEGELEAYCDIIVSTANGLEGTLAISTLVYPTVTTGEIIVEQQVMERITILNPQGAVLQIIIPQQAREVVDITGYEEGIYFIEIGEKTFKVIKK